MRCAEDMHGSECIGELVRYNYSIVGGSRKAVCTDNAGTCARALCECDTTFAINHALSTDEYNQQYSHFYGRFQYQTVCRKSF